jgi:hypothetical protein
MLMFELCAAAGRRGGAQIIAARALAATTVLRAMTASTVIN